MSHKFRIALATALLALAAVSAADSASAGIDHFLFIGGIAGETLGGP
jgi:hypothetical protein